MLHLLGLIALGLVAVYAVALFIAVIDEQGR